MIAAPAAGSSEPTPATPLPEAMFAPVKVASALSGVQPALEAELRLEGREDARFGPRSERPERAQPRVRDAQPIVIAIAPEKAAASTTSHVLRGAASWYCRAGVSPCTFTHPDVGGFDAYAAAGPKLRAAIGPAWRGSIVYVNGVPVRLIDWCQCYEGQRQEKLLDLYYDVYARTGGSVTLRW